jgi:hypothetical protein
LAQVIDRCLAKDPSARFANGGELAEALGRAVAEPVAPPLAVRAFLVESGHLSGPALVYVTIAGLAIPLLVEYFVSATEREPKLVAAGFIAWLLALPVALMFSRVRRLLAAGFDRDDLTDALAAELTRRREELVFLYGRGPSRLERAWRRIAHGALAAGVGAVALAWFAQVSALFATSTAAAAIALLAAVAARARTERRTDPRRERRLRFWRGPFGRWLFKVAGIGLGPKATAAERRRPGAPKLEIGVVRDRFFEARAGDTPSA